MKIYAILAVVLLAGCVHKPPVIEPPIEPPAVDPRCEWAPINCPVILEKADEDCVLEEDGYCLCPSPWCPM